MPDGAPDLVTDLYRRMPEARITDIPPRGGRRVTEAFTHLRTGSPCRDRIGLLNVLLAEGINLVRDLERFSDARTDWEAALRLAQESSNDALAEQVQNLPADVARIVKHSVLTRR